MAIKILNPKMRVNRFKLERVLSTKDIYSRMGVRCKAASSSDEVANFSRNPVELSDIDLANYDRMRREEWLKQEALKLKQQEALKLKQQEALKLQQQEALKLQQQQESSEESTD